LRRCGVQTDSQQHERQLRQPGQERQRPDHHGRDLERLGLAEQLTAELRAQVALPVPDPGDEQAGGHRDQEGRDLGDETVADGQERIGADGLVERHAEAHHTDREPADQVDRDDDHARHGVALDELRRTVHRPVEVRLHRDAGTPPPGLSLVDQPGGEVGVDGHLLARHRVEGEPGRHLGDAPGAGGDDGELDDDEDEEDDEADDHGPADHEVPEGLDDLAGVPVQQDQPRGRHVQCQPEHRRDQEQRRERGQLQRVVEAEHSHDDEHGERDVRCEQEVQQHRRQRDHHHQHDADEQKRHPEPRHATHDRRRHAATLSPGMRPVRR
jgi:hypothetical protein